jgi:hypothetical protein
VTSTLAASDPLDRLVRAASPRHVRRACLVVLAGDLLLISGYVGTTLAGWTVEMVDLDREINVPTWYASMKLFGIAVLLGFVATVAGVRGRRARCVLALPAALFAFLSMDEAARIHEWLGYRIDLALAGEGARSTRWLPATGYWMLALGPLLAGAMAASAIAYGRLVRPSRPVVGMAVGGMSIFLLGAVVLEIGSNFAEGPLARMLQNSLEEGAELIGVTLMLAAALHLAAGLVRESRGHRAIDLAADDTRAS